tara:strand:+ start:321 stop:854 length:534 start_codon:yes stop_codon:yes gene_type:complete
MSKYNTIIGIDIGMNGAICFMGTSLIGSKDVISGPILTTIPMPVVGNRVDWDEMYSLFNGYEGFRGLVVFEKLGILFGVSKSVQDSLGRQNEGMIVMCKMLAIPYREVPPKEWQAEMFKGISLIKKANGKKDTKAMALQKIRQIHPKLKLTFGERATKPHDGLIDAVLIAEYAERFL